MHMRKTGLTAITTSAALLAAGAAHAQFFNFTSSFTPNPVPSTQAGNNIQAATGSNNTGLFAGAFGTDIVVENFTANASSANNGTINTVVTISVSLTPSDNVGNPLPGDPPQTKTFTETLTANVSSNAVTSLMTPIPNPSIQTYSFPDGSVYTLQITSYTGPSAPNSTGSGSLGGHVNGALAGVRQNTPEPGSLALLLGMSISGTILARRRRRG
jgi:hypothetical protein